MRVRRLHERKKGGGTEWKGKGTIEYLCANYFPNCDVILPITSHSLEQTVSGSVAGHTEDHIADKMDIINLIQSPVDTRPSALHTP
jgi:hypothetical protein